MLIVEKLKQFVNANKWLSPDGLKLLINTLETYTIEIPIVDNKRLVVGDNLIGKSDDKQWEVIGFRTGSHRIVCKDSDGLIRDLKPEWVFIAPKFIDRAGQPLFQGKKVWYLDQTLRNDISDIDELPIWKPITIKAIVYWKNIGAWFVEDMDGNSYQYEPNKFRSIPYGYSPQQIDVLVNMDAVTYNRRVLRGRADYPRLSKDLTEEKYKHILSLIENR